jgi:hypothetical protein
MAIRCNKDNRSKSSISSTPQIGVNRDKARGDGHQPKLALVPVVGSFTSLTTAVLYAKEARAYIKISSAGFHQLVHQGIINKYTHVNGKRPFFLKHELDDYLCRLPRYKMNARESSQAPEMGGDL